MILDPPAAPTMKTASPFSSITIDGHIDDIGHFRGLIKFAGLGAIPYKFVIPKRFKNWQFFNYQKMITGIPGVAKSSI